VVVEKEEMNKIKIKDEKWDLNMKDNKDEDTVAIMSELLYLCRCAFSNTRIGTIMWQLTSITSSLLFVLLHCFLPVVCPQEST
jgi:hypothetical protein